MCFFARDYRAYRERRLETKPSLLAIFQSTDYLIYFKMHLEYAVSLNVRPNKMPYSALVIGGQTPKRPRPALDGRRRGDTEEGAEGEGAEGEGAEGEGAEGAAEVAEAGAQAEADAACGRCRRRRRERRPAPAAPVRGRLGLP